MASPVTRHSPLWANPAAQTGVPGSGESCPSAKPDTSTRINPFNEPDFLAACRSGDLQWVKEQISQDASLVHQEFRSGKTENMVLPLTMACRGGHKDIVQLLLDNGADVNRITPNGCDSLSAAIFSGREDLVEMLLHQPGVKVNTTSDRGTTPLGSAAYIGYTAIVRRLLQCRDIKVNGKTGAIPPLHCATLRGHGDVVALLLEHPKINVNAKDREGRTAIFLAGLRGCRETVIRLARAAGGVDDETDTQILFRQAMLSENQTLLRELLDKNPELARQRFPFYKKTEELYPYHVALQKRNEELAQLLLSRGANSDAVGPGGVTTLMVAAESGLSSLVKAMACRFASVDIDAVRDDGCKAIDLAVRAGHRDIVISLARVRGNYHDESDNQIAFRYAVRSGHHSWLEEILQTEPGLARNRFPFYEGEQDIYPLHVASERGYRGVAEQLLSSGAGVNDATNGTTALALASQKGFVDVTGLLLSQRSVKVDAACKDGATPLYVAAQNGHAAVVKQLLDKGADPKLKRRISWITRKSPLDIARENNHQDVVAHLKAAEQRPRKITENTPLLSATSE